MDWPEDWGCEVKADLSNLSTFQLASALQWKITGLIKKRMPDGMIYFVTLNGVEMRATEARKLCEDAIHIKQRLEA
jgi:hypothetical protein